MNWVSNNKLRLVTILLAIAGIVVAIVYAFCPGTCSALRGTLLFLDLKWVGIAFMTVIGLMAAVGLSPLAFFLAASAVGGEIVLVAFQVRNDVYCTYCLTFGAIAIALFLANFRRSRLALITALVAALFGFALFALFFKGTVIPVYS
jgi:hypothetical protein